MKKLGKKFSFVLMVIVMIFSTLVPLMPKTNAVVEYQCVVYTATEDNSQGYVGANPNYINYWQDATRVEAGESVTFYAKANEGYHFVRWDIKDDYYTDDVVGTSTDNPVTFTAEKEQCYFAVFEPDVTYNVIIHNGAPSQDSAKPGEKITIDADEAPRGKIFDKWEIISGAVVLENANEAPTTFTMGNEDVEIKAVYKPDPSIQYTVTFVLNGGTMTDPESALVNNGDKVEIPSYPTKDGYEFAGWYTDETYSKEFDFYNTQIMENKSIYAKWVKSHKVIYDLNGGTVEFELVPFSVEENFESLIPTWDELKDFITAPYSKIYDGVEINGVKTNVGENFIVKEDVTIRLLWKDKYTILEGDNQTYTLGSNTDIIIKATGDKEKIVSIEIDGGNVIKNSNYELEAGSTILTLKSSFLEEASVGKHTITFKYDDGEANAILTVAEKNNNDNNNGNNATPTNDNNSKGNNSTPTNSNNSGENNVTPINNNTADGTATNNKTKNPQTSDNITVYLITLLCSIIGMASGIAYINRKKYLINN